MTIKQQINDIKVEAVQSEARIINEVGNKMEIELRKSESHIAEMLNQKMGDMIRLSEKLNDDKYASKTIEKYFIRFFYVIGVIILGWFSHFFQFLVELFVKSR